MSLQLWRVSDIFKNKGPFSHGHYYSPTLDHTTVPESLPVNYDEEIEGIDLRPAQQFELLKVLAGNYEDDLFPVSRDDKSVYFFENNYFSYSDAIFLNLVLRHFAPRRSLRLAPVFLPPL